MVLGLMFGEKHNGDPDERNRSDMINDMMSDRFVQDNRTCICNELLECDITTPEGVRFARENGLFKDFCPKMVASSVDILEGPGRQSKREKILMKNNIIISGVPRAGKSTISHLLSKNYGYQHISMDSIIAGFEKCFPETGVNTYQGLSSMDTLRVISGKMAPFVRSMLDSGEYDEFAPGMVLDMYQLLPEDYDKYIRGANCDIVYFITSDVTPEERFKIQKKYDTEKDYTFYKSDEELREGAEYIVEQSILMRKQCEKLGIPFYETAKEREQVFKQFMKDFGYIIEL